MTISRVLKKQYQYKLFARDNVTILETLDPKKVLNKPDFRARMNAGLGQLRMQYNSGSFSTFSSNFSDMNIIKIFEYDEIRTSPRLIYSGYIADVVPFIDGSVQGIEIMFLGWFSLLSFDYYNFSDTNFTVTRSSEDPSDMVRDIIDHHKAANLNSPIFYSGSSIDDVGTTETQKFVDERWNEALETARSISGGDWYFFLDKGGKLYFKPKPTTATHKFTIGWDIENLRYKLTNRKIVNKTFLRYDTGLTANIESSNASSITSFDQRREIIEDERITILGTATTKVDNNTSENKDKLQNIEFIVLNSRYDFETIRAGEACSVLNQDNPNLFPSVMQIHATHYKGDTMLLEVEDFTDFVDRMKGLIKRVK